MPAHFAGKIVDFPEPFAAIFTVLSRSGQEKDSQHRRISGTQCSNGLMSTARFDCVSLLPQRLPQGSRR